MDRHRVPGERAVERDGWRPFWCWRCWCWADLRCGFSGRAHCRPGALQQPRPVRYDGIAMKCDRMWVWAAATVLVGGTGVARADTTWVDEYLDDGACDAAECTVSQGQFVANEGWQTRSLDSRLVFDLTQVRPGGIPCGTMEVEFTNFDPITNFHGTFGERQVFHIGMYEGSHGSMNTANNNDETQLQVAAFCRQCDPNADPNDYWRSHRFKYMAIPCGWSSGCTEANRQVPTNAQYSIDWSATLGLHYIATVTWDCSGLNFALNDGTHNWTSNSSWSWHAGHLEPWPHIRYVFVGKDHSAGNNWIEHSIYVRVIITEQSACDCNLNTPPETGGIQVYAQDLTRLDNGGPPAHPGDTVSLRAAVQDVETADADMQNARFYLRTSGSSTWDLLDGVAAVYDPNTPNLNWFYDWTIPASVPLGWVDIRFYYEDEGGLPADQTQQNEFQIVEAALPDGGAGPEDSAVGPADGQVQPDGAHWDGGQGDGTSARGGCDCRAAGAAGTSETPGAFAVFLLLALVVWSGRRRRLTFGFPGSGR